MASGGKRGIRQRFGGNCSSCSICLESFLGRSPKILSCFHSFCLPCLSQLAEQAKQNLQKVSSNAEEPFSSEDLFISCPTCRVDVQVPDGGVTKFQTNFYLDEDQNQGHIQPLICDLCDQDQVASHFCKNCQMKLCFHCHRNHGDCTQTTGPATAKTMDASSNDTTELLTIGKAQMEVILKMLSCYAEQEKELHKQKESLEDDVHSLYTNGVSCLSDARNEILREIRSHAENSEEKLKKEVTDMQKKYDTLAHFASQTDTSTVTVTDLQAALMTDSELSKLQKREEQKTVQFFRHKSGDGNPVSLVNGLRELVFGTLECVSDTQDSGDLNPSILIGAGTAQSRSQAQEDLHLQLEKVSSVLSRMDSLTEKVDFMNKKLKENESKERKLETEMRSMVEEVKVFRDKNSLLMQELASVQFENVKLRESVSQLQVSHQTHSHNTTTVEAQSTEGASASKTCPQQTASLQKGKDLATDSSTSLKRDVDTLVQETAALRTNLTQSSSQIQNLQQQVYFLQNAMRNKAEQQQITSLGRQIEKTFYPVYFKAVLDRRRQTHQKRHLICKNVVENEGNSYDSYTGEFTAPADGIYLFIVNVASFSENKPAYVKIVLNIDDCIGHAFCDIGDSGTGSAVVRLTAGESVWLGTTSSPLSFAKEDTYFSGMLIMPVKN